jgi:hypothetical protein
MKKIIIWAIIIILVAGGVWLIYFYGGNQGTKTIVIKDRIGTSTLQSFKDSTYLIDGQPVTLVNGAAESEIATGSAEKQITKYFGNEATGDLNGDRLDDVAFLLTQDNGGSGTFYYVIAALRTDNGYQGTNAIFLGDRIAPQSTEINNGVITVDYADRKAGEPFTTQPSVGVSKYFKIFKNQLVPIPAPGANSKNSAAVIEGLRQILVDQYKNVTSTPDHLWWLDQSGIAVNIRATSTVSFAIPAGIYGGGNSLVSATIIKSPLAAKAAGIIGQYFLAQNFVLDSAQSTDVKNSDVERAVYTQAYYSADSLVRCRLSIFDKNVGVGETEPFMFNVSIDCVDSSDYQSAYDYQAPVFAGLSGKLAANDLHIMLFNQFYPRVCQKEPSLTIFEFTDISKGTDDGYFAMYDNGGIWTDSGLKGLDIAAQCGTEINSSN